EEAGGLASRGVTAGGGDPRVSAAGRFDPTRGSSASPSKERRPPDRHDVGARQRVRTLGRVDITFDRALLATTTTDPSGAFQAQIRIPAFARPGRHQIHAAG